MKILDLVLKVITLLKGKLCVILYITHYCMCNLLTYQPHRSGYSCLDCLVKQH